MSNFMFKILNGADPNAQYAAITTPDPLTFYLLGNGVGYLGTTPLFGGDTQKVVVMTSGTLTNPEQGKLYVLDSITYDVDILTGLYFYNGTSMVSYSDKLMSEYIADIMTTSMTGVGYTGDDNTFASTKAIIDVINLKLSDSSIVNAAFFRKVESHVLTAEDISNVAISKPEGVLEGDVGLLFTADTNAEAGGEEYYYVSLKNYVTIYTASSTNSIEMSVDDTNNITANLKIKSEENSLKVDDVNGGVYLEKTESINETTPSANSLVTEAALVSYIQNSVLTAVTQAINEAMSDVVTYGIDDGTAQ